MPPKGEIEALKNNNEKLKEALKEKDEALEALKKAELMVARPGRR